MHQSLRRPRVQKKKRNKNKTFFIPTLGRPEGQFDGYCSKPLALQEYSFLSSECAANKLHLECYSVVEYANSDYDGYIRLLVLKRCLFLLISYKLPFDLYSIIVQSITLSKMKASVEMEISQNCITTLESLLPRKQFLLRVLLFATPQLSSRIITYKLHWLKPHRYLCYDQQDPSYRYINCLCFFFGTSRQPKCVSIFFVLIKSQNHQPFFFSVIERLVQSTKCHYYSIIAKRSYLQIVLVSF